MEHGCLFERDQLIRTYTAEAGELGDRFFGWLEAARPRLLEDLDEFGGILFRGFLDGSRAELERFNEATGLRTMRYRGGYSPRGRGRKGVYHSTFLDPRLPIPLHCELSYLGAPPRYISFLCEKRAERNGRTPLADMRRVYEAMPEEIRDSFARRGVRYSSRLPTRPMRGRVTWKDVYEADSREEVEEILRSLEQRFSWDGEFLEVSIDLPACRPHPENGTMIWFNQVPLCHPSYSQALRRYHFHAANVLWIYERLIGERKRPTNLSVFYGDGGPISRRTVWQIRQTLWNHTRAFDWREGDLLFLDNRRVAHGREPYKGARVVLASLYDDWSRR
jgi:alpha-ketoglutarate-dependent taurine dioxygenase